MRSLITNQRWSVFLVADWLVISDRISAVADLVADCHLYLLNRAELPITETLPRSKPSGDFCLHGPIPATRAQRWRRAVVAALGRVSNCITSFDFCLHRTYPLFPSIVHFTNFFSFFGCLKCMIGSFTSIIAFSSTCSSHLLFWNFEDWCCSFCFLLFSKIWSLMANELFGLDLHHSLS